MSSCNDGTVWYNESVLKTHTVRGLRAVPFVRRSQACWNTVEDKLGGIWNVSCQYEAAS